MRSGSDPLLGPSATKESALRLIRTGIEQKGGAASAARIAKECLVRGYLLSHEERLLVGFAILIGTTRREDVETGEASWRLASNALLKRGRADLVLHMALRIFTTELARAKYPKAYKGLERAKVAAERLPAHHAGRLQYASCIDEYVRVTGDVKAHARLAWH